MADMPAPAPTNLQAGGKPTEATIDQANIGMRAMPFYQDYMRSIGQDPAHPTLTKDQSKGLLRQAQANGFVVDEGNMEMDNHGNFNPKGHKLRNTLIVAGIAGATIATMGAAGVFGPGALSLGAVEGGAAGLPASAVAGLGTGAMSAVPLATGAGLAGLAPLASTAVTPTSSILAGGTGALSTGSRFANILGGAEKLGSLLGGGSTPGVDANGNPVNAPTGAAQAATAQALTNNRFLAAPINQRGPEADKAAMQNMLRAGLIAQMPNTGQPLSVGGYALPNLSPNAASTGFASSMQDQLAKRMATGKPLTLSGLAEPTQEELDAQAAAQNSAGTGVGVNSTLTRANNAINTAGNVIGTGVRYANLGKDIWNTAKGLFK